MINSEKKTIRLVKFSIYEGVNEQSSVTIENMYYDIYNKEVVFALQSWRYGNDILFLFGKNAIYTVDLKAKLVTNMSTMKFANMIVVDQLYIYSLMDDEII